MELVIIYVLVIYSKIMQKKLNQQRAFTLLELLVVISIIGILIALGVTSYITAQRRTRDAKRKADLETVRQGLVLYRQDNGDYGNFSAEPDFAAIVSILYTDGYLTSDNIADPKTSDDSFFYSLVCDPVPAAASCDRVVLTAPLETEEDSYVIRTP